MALRLPARQQQLVITVEPRYVDRDKLKELLARLFPPKTYAVEVSHPGVVIGILSGAAEDQHCVIL